MKNWAAFLTNDPIIERLFFLLYTVLPCHMTVPIIIKISKIPRTIAGKRFGCEIITAFSI